MPSKKRRRRTEDRPTIHPRNRYSENPPDFHLLASLYPSFKPFVFYSRDGLHPRIDWTDFNATRELTRVLLEHDHGVKWWIPDGQLCPTVPNRSNYIHWIEDLLLSDVIAKTNTGRDKVRGFDIGTGANCIYPLLGASLLGWSFVGSDVTDVALEWAERNVKSNPHLSELIEIRKAVIAEETLSRDEAAEAQFACSELIEIRKAGDTEETLSRDATAEAQFACSELIEIRKAGDTEETLSRDETAEAQFACSELIEIRKAGDTEETLSRDEASKDQLVGTEIQGSSEAIIGEDVESLMTTSLDVNSDSKDCKRRLVLVGVVKDGESFDFCMCNPPFFDSMEDAGLNPKTSCGGTPEEMVCPGGEKAFIIRIIEDSVVLKQSFRWYTSMIGRKANLKFLVSKLRGVGVSIVKTTEFVQGQTCRWGLAWSFVPPVRKIILSHVVEKNNLSFMLEGLPRQVNAIDILKSVESYFLASGAFSKSNSTSFVVDVTASNEQCHTILNKGSVDFDETTIFQPRNESSDSSNPLHQLSFRVSVFQQIPGTLLVRGSLQHKGSPLSGAFSLMFQGLEEALKEEFCKQKSSMVPC